MRALNVIAIEIYQNLREQYRGPYERMEATRQYILNEITQWDIKTLRQGNNYYFKPDNFKGDNTSPQFEVRLIYNPELQYHELKFGNLNAETDEKKFKWDDKDPYRLQKALFLRSVLHNKVKVLLQNEDIMGIFFIPYDKDNLGSDRLSYFLNMYSNLNKNDFTLEKGEFETEGMYFITKKQ
jgi:hypothetical protein